MLSDARAGRSVNETRRANLAQAANSKGEEKFI
jgi:hypothetical protein